MGDAINKETKILLDASQTPLPASPFHISALAKEIKAPNINIKDLAQLILRDFGLTFYYLKWINSAFFSSGIHQPPISMTKIIMMLGLDNISSTLNEVPSLSREQLAASDPYNRCQLFTLAKATLAGHFAGKISEVIGINLEVSSLLAMSLNLGECITALAFPRVAILLDSIDNKKERHKMAKRFLFHTPEELGFQVAKRWNLPELILNLLSNANHYDSFKNKDISFCLAYGINKLLCEAQYKIKNDQKPKKAFTFLESQLQLSSSKLISLITAGLSDLKGDNPAFYQVLCEQGLINRLPI